jgi:hypothetical protein
VLGGMLGQDMFAVMKENEYLWKTGGKSYIECDESESGGAKG